MSKHLVTLAPALSLLLAVASVAGRRMDFTVYLNHGVVASYAGRIGVYSRSVFDRFPVFYAEWWELAIGFGFLTLFLAMVWAISQRLETVFLVESRQCLRCGYDLTANTSGVCPECGTAVVEPNAH